MIFIPLIVSTLVLLYAVLNTYRDNNYRDNNYRDARCKSQVTDITDLIIVLSVVVVIGCFSVVAIMS